MSVTIPTDNRNILDECDATTGWTGSATVQSITSNPAPIETGASLAMAVGNTTDDAYKAITSDDYSGGGTIAVWVRAFGAMDTKANGGIQIVVGDGTNRIGYHVGGSDQSGFRHEVGPVEWACFLLDLANKPANSTAYAGSEASLDETAITQIGVAFKTLYKALGGSANCFWDIIRFADNGDDVILLGGATSGAAGNASEAAAVDRATGNQQAYGVIRELGAGLYGIQGNLTIGNASSSSDQYWEEANVVYAWEDRGLSSNNYYLFKIIGSSTATNCEASFTACSFVVPSGADASFDGNGADMTVVTITGCTFIGFGQGITTSDDTGDDWTNNTFIDNGQITAKGCDLTGSSVEGYEGTANTSALIWNQATDPDGYLDDMTYTKGTAATHAIEFGLTSPTTMTLRGLTFSGYSASNNANDSAIHVKRTSGTVTINAIGCTGTVSYRTDGATVNVVTNPVSLSVHVQDIEDEGDISGARVLATVASGIGGWPYQASVTLSRSLTTVTVSHTGHGLSAGDHVLIEGADQEEYNGVWVIDAVLGANSYTYIMTRTPLPTSPATGTITSTFVIINETTDVNGDAAETYSYSSDQPITGRVRKASGSGPFYKTAPLSGTIDSENGLAITVQMIPDE